MTKNLLLKTLAMMTTIVVLMTLIPMQAQVAEASNKSQVDFKDVPKSHPFYKEISTMRDEGIIKGYTDNTFKPTQPISRVHVASLFVRSLDLKPIRSGKEFKDVPKSNVYYNDVQAVYRAGIFDGNTDGTFGVNDNLTRAQMAKVLVNAFNLDIKKGYIFDDIGSSHWAKDYIATLYTNGITVGSNGKFLPNDSVTRAHYSAFLYRALHPEDAPKPGKPLQSSPPVVKPQPKPEVKPTPKPTPSPSEGVKKPAKLPAGASVISDNGLAQEYSYNKNLPDGGKIHKISVDKGSVTVVGIDKNGTTILFSYNYKANNSTFDMTKPSVSDDSMSVLYEIAYTFADAYGF